MVYLIKNHTKGRQDNCIIDVGKLLPTSYDLHLTKSHISNFLGKESANVSGKENGRRESAGASAKKRK